ncbi:MAG: uracil-DNA glycosylase [Clostridia bacterium]|nr:uracil-DNA glycosylase [Clostridia bacterium]
MSGELDRMREELNRLIAELYEGEKKILVHGEGEIGARVMLVGEAPGEQETLQGRPFVGKAGKNLNEFLELAGMERGELYVTNAVKFRPTKRSAAGRTVNRPPTREEVSLFLPWLRREIELVAPEVIVTLGNVPLRALTGPKAVIGDVHGAFQDVDGLRLYPMYHPASLIYNPALREVYAEDIRRLSTHLRAENPEKK